MKKKFFVLFLVTSQLIACPLCMHDVRQETDSRKKIATTAHHTVCSCDCTQHRHNGIVCEKCGHKVKSHRHHYSDETIKPRQ